MARSRGGRVSKSASQTLPVRGTQPRPLIGARNVQTMITHFSRQERPRQAQEGDQAGRNQVPNGPLFQAQSAQSLDCMDVSEAPGTSTSGHTAVGSTLPVTANTQAASVQADAGDDDPPQQQVQDQAQQLDQGEPELESFELGDRVRPEVPPAEPLGPSTQGWESIRRLGGWQLPNVRRGL